MSKTFCLSSFLPVLFLVVVAVQATRTGRIRITEGDPRDLTLYKGPSNEYTPGRSPLPSYILRAKPAEEQGDRGLYGFVGSQKPEWTDETDPQSPPNHRNDVIQYYTLDCYPDEPCSQSIPLDVDPNAEIGRPNLVTHSDSDFGSYNEVNNEQIPTNRFSAPAPKQNKVEEPIQNFPVTREPNRFTMGPSVASMYGTNGLGPHYPATKRPQETRPPSTEPRFVSTNEPDPTILLPSNYKQNRYDPFLYHQNKLKRGSTSPARADPRTTFLQQEPPVYHSHYTDSRTFSAANQPSYTFKDSVMQRYQQVTRAPLPQVPLRNSLSWKGTKNQYEQNHPKRDTLSGQHQSTQFESPQRLHTYKNNKDDSGNGNHRRQDGQSTAEAFRSPHIRFKEDTSGPAYFPSYQDDYTSQDTTTTKRSKIESSVPKRDYFPVKTDSQDYDQPKSDYTDHDLQNYYQDSESKLKLPPKVSDEESYYESERHRNYGQNKYVGDPTSVNAGIVVTEQAEDSDFEKDFVSKPSVFAKPSDFVTSYDERYGWSAAPNSGRGSQGKRVAQSPPVPPPVVNTWTSIDAAKPQWEEQSFSNTFSTTTTDKPEKDEKDPYGKWSGGDMKLTAVPFSRAEDGNNRKWVLMTRSVSKEKGRRHAKQAVAQGQVPLSVAPKKRRKNRIVNSPS